MRNSVTIESLLTRINDDKRAEFDVDKIIRAYSLAKAAHEGQTRSSGEPYISHPLAVADILLNFNMDTDAVVAALLHDVVEDTEITAKMLDKQFGKTVTHLVEGVTKIGLIPLDATKEEQHAENIRKILMAMAKDVRVILIKLADRLHNMRTLASRPQEKQRENALETMSFYAPIAHRLGMNSVKEEMEDLSLRYLDPIGYRQIEEYMKTRETERNAFIERKKTQILERIGDMQPPPVIEGRVKGIYSIYKKVIVGGREFDEIYDIYAVRIIVRSLIECYNILGIIHDAFRPIPLRFKDYIATPKPNRYQSLHTTVMSREAIPFEVQIRTHEMHNTAEYGIAAHWRYKAGLETKKLKAGETARLEWIHHILDQQQNSDNIEQITEAVKIDLSPEDVYVFTPKGDIETLPEGSTVIDFAYAIHTQVGNKMTGAKVNGRMVSFDYKLETGNIVEIMTTNSSAYGPSRDWLDIVKTNQAKVKIRTWFKKERRSENISQGKAMLEREFKRNKLPFEKDLLSETAIQLRYKNADEFLAAIGYGGLSTTRAVSKAKEIYGEPEEEKEESINIEENIARRQSKGVLVDGMENCLVRFANCCTPLPGDEITGFITRGYGVSVHKKSCRNAPLDEERLIKVEWLNADDIKYRAGIEITAENRTGLISDLAHVISHDRHSINELNGRTLKNGNALIEITLEIPNLEHLNTILAKLRRVTGVIIAARKED